MGSTSEIETWCVLRTSARYTIPLSETLLGDGFEVWTPIETKMVRVPRKSVKREVRLPIMPSYIFAKSDRLVDLLMLEDTPVKLRRAGKGSHYDFSVMRSFGEIPLVRDGHLTALRGIESKRTPTKAAEKAFASGVSVKVDGGSFGGMFGIVDRSDRTHTLVCFNDRYLVKIPTLLLVEDGGSDETEIAVQKAA